MPAESQKLVAKGKVLNDLSMTLKDYKLGEGSFIVVMKEKPKPAPANLPKEEVKKEEEAPKSGTAPNTST